MDVLALPATDDATDVAGVILLRDDLGRLPAAGPSPTPRPSPTPDAGQS